MHKDTYRRMDDTALHGFSAALDRVHGSKGFAPGVANCAQDVYRRKFTADFTVEMNRSVQVWLDRWQTPGA